MKSSISGCSLLCLSYFIATMGVPLMPHAQVVVSGELKKWHKITLICSGTPTSESSSVNPFTDYRITATFTNGSDTFIVPGFYAADGNAAETSADAGDKWLVRFTPDLTGEWHYAISFRTGANIAVTNDTGVAVLPLHGSTGSFFIQQTDKSANDFRAKGMLRYVGKHHLQFAETGTYFIKGGTNSPENFLAYYEFDQTIDLGGGNDNTLTDGLHQYALHVQHWHQGDPSWKNGKGKGIIGALNYLAAQKVNSVYFLPYTLDGGDGRDTWMWTSPSVRERFDCSKLAQWEIVFSHMDSLGIQLHLVTQEQENDQSLGDSLQQLNNIRKLYYRELVARFSHHPALQWNIGEENSNTDSERVAFAQYIRDLDPYTHPIAIHTTNGTAPTFYDTIFAAPAQLQFFEAASLQGIANKYNSWAIQLRDKSTLSGKKWAIYGDEQIPSVSPDGSDFDELRRDALWGNLMGGGAGVEWYFGYQGEFGDLQTENFALVEQLWKYTGYAVDFFQQYLPFHEMTPQNNLLINSTNEDYCFAKAGQTYAAYLETDATGNLRIALQAGSYQVRWYNPRIGGALQNGSLTAINASASGNYAFGTPPSGSSGDWVVLLTNAYEPITLSAIVNNATCFGNEDGSIEIFLSGGAPPFIYQWSNGENSNLAQQLAAGEYRVTVTDAFLHTASDTFMLTQPDPLIVQSSATIQNGFGNITLSPEGGIPPYAYSWNFGAKTNPADSLLSGNYCVTITDANGCVFSLCDTIDIPPCTQPPFICSDNNPCTTDECVAENCISTPVQCDDADYCTIDYCDTLGACQFTPFSCNDNNGCTTDNCTPETGCVFVPVICNDQIACTADTCILGVCDFIATDCNDGNACTIDNCDTSGACIYIAVSCDDNELCTVDGCDSASGCYFSAITCLDDGNACIIESCDSGICISTPVYCNDSNACTTDSCTNGQCIFTPRICNDNNSCTEDTCENGECSFTPILCNDNNLCTTDACINGQCVYTAEGLMIARLVLVNSTTDNDIRFLNEHDTINLAVTPSVNIRAEACAEVKSVKFILNDNTFRTENSIPFSLAGDASGNYSKWSISTGFYTLITRPHSALNAGGTAGVEKIVTIRVINQVAPACVTDMHCNDNNACTNNSCQSGQCVFPQINCTDDNLCTNDLCTGGICSNTAIVCNDNNACTTDECSTAAGCIYSALEACCVQHADCNDSNACTVDACNDGTCSYTQGGNEPAYLRIVNPSKSWRKLKLGYSATSLYSPRQNVSETGNNQMCITLRTVGAPEWNKMQIRPQGSSSASVTLSNYVSGAVDSWTTFCIPLSAFSRIDFSQVSYIGIPYSNGAATFEIHLREIIFTGGTTPFLWFGNEKTDNIHDGQSGSGSALIASLVAGNPCSLKMEDGEIKGNATQENAYLNVYPNPFKDKLIIEFSISDDTQATLEIFNASGQLLEKIFNEKVDAAIPYKIEYVPEVPIDGVIIYKLQSAKQVYFGKAIMLE